MPNQNNYVSSPLLQINGADAPLELMKNILQISVEESLHLPAMFMLVIYNTYLSARPDDKPWHDEHYFKIGDKLNLGFNSSTTDAPEYRKDERSYLINGEVTAIEINFTNKSEAHIVVRGYDLSHRLHRGRYNRSFLNQTDSDIVKQIASELGIDIGQVDPSGEPHDYVFQENQTNMEFLRERAARIGFELFIRCDNNIGISKLYFRKPESNTSLNLKWLTDIDSFSTRVTSAEQVSSVEVRSWDYSQKTPIISTAQSEQLVTQTGNGRGSSTSNAFNNNQPPKMTVVDQPVFKPKHADAMAQALFNELGGEFVYVDAKAEGNPQIRAGIVIQLNFKPPSGSDYSGRYDGSYYVTETRHLYQQQVYTTYFSVRGLRGGSLLTTLSPQVRLQPGQTLLVGIVTNNQDPRGWGRVKVKFPTLTEEHESNWARVIGLGAGANRGFYCLPEVNDEVLVGFEHGDIHRPYIIGGVWNGKDPTVETVGETTPNGQVLLRTIKTRTGHKIQFVDIDGAQPIGGSVNIETAGGHKIHLNDTPQQSIQIQTIAGQQMTLNDDGLTVTIQTGGMINIDAGADISITAAGAVSIDAGADVSVTAAGAVSIEAVGDVNLAAAGAVSIEAVGDVNLAASAVTIEAAIDINLVAPSISTEGVLTNNGMPVAVIPA